MSPLLRTTSASFSFVRVHVGATLHAQEITFSWKSIQPNNQPIRDDRYSDNDFTVNPTRARTRRREGMRSRPKRNGEFSFVHPLFIPLPLSFTQYNFQLHTPITYHGAFLFIYNRIAGYRRGQDAFDYRTSTGAGERRAPHNTDIYPRAS